MSVGREDLVGFALGALGVEETERIRRAVAEDPALAARLKDIEGHLALHDHVLELRPEARLWKGIEARLDEVPARRPLLRRFWMPAAAAALVALAFLWPARTTSVERMHGQVARAGNTYRCATVARVRIGDGVVVTADTGTVFQVLAEKRLALRAGRVFLEVSGEPGFRVEAGELRAMTTGTAFLVEAGDLGPGVVRVEKGQVRCSWRSHTRLVGPGGHFLGQPDPVAAKTFPESPRAWFQRPTLTARILDPDTIRVVIRNDMPDLIEVAPPTGGEPLFYASYGGHNVPLTPDDLDPLVLSPGTDKSFLLRLPRPLKDREALLLSYPEAALRVEASR